MTMLRGLMTPLTVAMVLASSLLFLHSLPVVSAAGHIVIDESLTIPSPPVDETVQNHRQLKGKRVAEPTPVPPTSAPVPTTPPAPTAPQCGTCFSEQTKPCSVATEAQDCTSSFTQDEYKCTKSDEKCPSGNDNECSGGKKDRCRLQTVTVTDFCTNLQDCPPPTTSPTSSPTTSMPSSKPSMAPSPKPSPTPTPECTVDADCADSSVCNGDEICVGGTCQAGTNPCEGTAQPHCVENLSSNDHTCVECQSHSHCTDISPCLPRHCHGDGYCYDATSCAQDETCIVVNESSFQCNPITDAPSQRPSRPPSKSASPTVEPLLRYVFDNDCTAVPGHDPATGTCPGSTPLNRCEGDCDSNGNCAKGLVCHQRGSGSSTVPGCSGTPHTDKDYCVLPAPNELVYVFDNTASDNVNTTTLKACQGDW